MKKILSFMIAMMMAVSFVFPAVAAEPLAVCAHDYQCVGTTTVYRYYNTDYHKRVIVYSYVCVKCGDSDPREVVGDVGLAHYNHYTDASCNGTIQTHYLYCNTCYTNYTITVTCPLAPHNPSRQCPLPA